MSLMAFISKRFDDGLLSEISKRFQAEGLLGEGPRRLFLRERFGFQLVPAGANEVDQILVIAQSDWASNAARGWVERFSQMTDLSKDQRDDMFDWTKIKYAASLVKASSRATSEAFQRLKDARTPGPGRPPAPGTIPGARRKKVEAVAPAPETPEQIRMKAVVAAAPVTPPPALVAPLTVEKVKSLLPRYPQKAAALSIISDAKRLGIPEAQSKAAIAEMIRTGEVDLRNNLLRRKKPQ